MEAPVCLVNRRAYLYRLVETESVKETAWHQKV